MRFIQKFENKLGLKPFKYANGKIYRIVSNKTATQYIGSTAETLQQRLKLHESAYKVYQRTKKNYTTSFDILESNDYRIELLEDYPCKNRQELEAREGHHIKNNPCINHSVAGRTRKQYNHDHKDRITLYYYIKNQNPFLCECGRTYEYTKKTSHQKTRHHLNHINGLNIVEVLEDNQPMNATEEDKQNIVARHIEAMIDAPEEVKPKKKDVRVRNRKEYMSRYYTVHRTKIMERSKKRYTPKKEKPAEKIPE
jgi:hypothetical protein